MQHIVHVKEFLERAFEVFALKAHHQRLSLRFILSETLPPLIVDRVILVRTLHLLIDRALTVTPAGGVVVRANRIAGDVVVAVDDGGPLVSPQDVPRLFLPGSVEPDLLTAADLTRELGGTLTASVGSQHIGLRIRLRVPLLPSLTQRPCTRE